MARPYTDAEIAALFRETINKEMKAKLNRASVPTGQTIPPPPKPPEGTPPPPPPPPPPVVVTTAQSEKALAFIEAWQSSHSSNEGIVPLYEALLAAGFDVTRPTHAGPPGEPPPYSDDKLIVEGTMYDLIYSFGGDDEHWSLSIVEPGDGGEGREVFLSRKTLENISESVSDIAHVSAAWVLKRFRENPPMYRGGSGRTGGTLTETATPAKGQPVLTWPNGDGPKIDRRTDQFDPVTQRWVTPDQNNPGHWLPVPQGDPTLVYLPGQGPGTETTYEVPVNAAPSIVTREWTARELAELSAMMDTVPTRGIE